MDQNERKVYTRRKPELEIDLDHFLSPVFRRCDYPSLQHGSVMEDDFSFGQWVTFQCDRDYELVGETSLQCVLGDTPDDCKWSGELPTCKCT